MQSQNVPFLDLGATYRELRTEIDAACRRVLESGWFLLGPELERFEHEWATYCGAGHCAAVGSGLDALTLSLMALDVGPGDEVIVPTNTYIATWLAVSAVGATIVPVEPDVRSYNITVDSIAAAITPRTAAVIPVHLYGLPVDAPGIDAVCERHGIPVVYDAAQAHGARIGGEPIGGFGTITAWSFYPGKNLGAFADGGAVTSSDVALVDRIKRLRNYGSVKKYFNVERGMNSRLDELQAAILSTKLSRLDEWNERRRRVAGTYLEHLSDIDCIPPEVTSVEDSVWHLFVLRSSQRDALQRSLAEHGVESLIHYPVPPHRQGAYADLKTPPLPVAEDLAGEVLSLPIGPHMRPKEVNLVVNAVLGFED